MKNCKFIFLLIIAPLVMLNCTADKYITDYASAQRQELMKKHKAGENFIGIAIEIGSAVMGVSVHASQEFKSFVSLKLKNESLDTCYVNMVTDYLWNDSTYCDIRDIVLPPLRKSRVIVPYGAAYNVYYRTRYASTYEMKLEINTADKRRIKLKDIPTEKNTGK